MLHYCVTTVKMPSVSAIVSSSGLREQTHGGWKAKGEYKPATLIPSPLDVLQYYVYSAPKLDLFMQREGACVLKRTWELYNC
jgi:hypothetical protein